MPRHLAIPIVPALILNLAALVVVLVPRAVAAQEASGPPQVKAAEDRPLVLAPDRVFDSVANEPHAG
jgi:hypothetical protein